MDWDRYFKSISNGLYNIIQNEIGSKAMVQNRRMFMELDERIFRIRNEHTGYLISGSRSEGFRFRTSDIDSMLIYSDIMITIDDTIRFNSREDKMFLRMETNQTRPGFCLLRVLPGIVPWGLQRICTQYQSSVYVSSFLWRNETLGAIRNSQTHGPCENGMLGATEGDIAHCFHCEQFSRPFYDCISRLARLGWPSTFVLTNIFNSGCHVVPIGDKLSDRELLEWRLSFSGAEKKLIHEMNHCQFLCYGLLKIFLKEAIDTNREVNGLLCSYFLKTLILWEITFNRNRNLWVEQDFIKWFWICFRRLISWVSDGYCPNFFIPENNMFLGKIYGRSQHVLLHHLISIYKEGYKCLLKCASLCDKLTSVYLFSNIIPLESNNGESMKVSENVDFISEMYDKLSLIGNTLTVSKIISLLEHIQRLNENKFISLPKDILLRHYKQNLLFASIFEFFPTSYLKNNRLKYEIIRKHVNALRKHNYDIASHRILPTLILYKFGMYQHVIRMALDIKGRIQGPNIYKAWYPNNRHFFRLGGEYMSIDSFIGNFVLDDVELDKYTYFPELYLEHQASCCNITYPPLVLLNMMLFFSYYYQTMYNEADSVLRDIDVLVKNYSDFEMRPKGAAISWEILGLCQETMGHFRDAYLSYQRSLREEFSYKFRDVTLTRMQRLESILNYA